MIKTKRTLLGKLPDGIDIDELQNKKTLLPRMTVSEFLRSMYLLEIESNQESLKKSTEPMSTTEDTLPQVIYQKRLSK